MKKDFPIPHSVVKVGDGRGFVVEYSARVNARSGFRTNTELSRKRMLFVQRRLVVTAAHCLPNLPPAHAASYLSDRTYGNLLGSLDGSKRDVWAECLFANPVADIAVLGCPDGQELYDEAVAYEALTDGVPALRIGKARSGRGWVLALNGHWIHTTLQVFSGLGGTVLEIDPTEPGMSGSPILNDVGLAVGVVAVGTETASATRERKNERASLQPILTRDLPGWLVQSL